jgi:hypothetical protein
MSEALHNIRSVAFLATEYNEVLSLLHFTIVSHEISSQTLFNHWTVLSTNIDLLNSDFLLQFPVEFWLLLQFRVEFWFLPQFSVEFWFFTAVSCWFWFFTAVSCWILIFYCSCKLNSDFFTAISCKHLSDAFSFQSGLTQGDALLPLLFNVALECH